MWQKIKNWFSDLFSKKKAEETATAVKSAIVDTVNTSLNDFVNDPENQKAALKAITSVAKSGVTEIYPAWRATVSRSKSSGQISGICSPSCIYIFSPSALIKASEK